MITVKVYSLARAVAVAFAVLFFFYTFNFFGDDLPESRESFRSSRRSCTPWRKWVHSIRKCLISAFETNSAWYMLEKIIFDCVDRDKLRTMSVRALTNIDDTKLAVLDLEAKTPCNVVSFGIGDNIHGEQALAKVMPHCQFFGADPVNESGAVYKRIGDWVDMAVGPDSLMMNRTIVIKGKKYRAQMLVANFVDFVKVVVNSTFIDFLFMDVAGLEYGILGTYFKKGPARDITICQITVELHGPPGMYGMTKHSYDEFIVNLVTKSPFVPFWSKEHGRHTKLYLFNVDNRYCVEKFVSQMC